MQSFIILLPKIKLVASLLGGIFELIGVLLMSRRYINVEFFYSIQGLFSALWRGQTATDISKIEHFSVENSLLTLQGLSYIGVGFLLTTTVTLLSLFDK